MFFGELSHSRRTPLVWAGILTGILLVAAAFPIAPLRDAETWAAVSDARLRLSPAFLVLAPVNNILDAVTLLSVREHATLIAALLATYLLVRACTQVRRTTGKTGWARELALAGVALMALLAAYAVTVLVPRPMAALSLADSDLVSIDFHSHTEASHDGRPGFSAERNRAWHAAAGFDAAYISDHFTFAGAEAAARRNPSRAGGGTTLLSAIECLEGGEHVNVLGVTAADYAFFRGREVAAPMVMAAVPAGRQMPVLVQTIPGPLDRVPRPGMSGVVPVSAIEISDGAPRGLGSEERDRAAILHLADSLDLAVVAGSDNHGWGRTAAGWSVFRVPDWRSSSPGELEQRIEDAIRVHGRRTGRVIERTRAAWTGTRAPRAVSPEDRGWRTRAAEMGAPAAFLAQFTWQLAATRSWPERISWLAWIWAVSGMVWWRRSH